MELKETHTLYKLFRTVVTHFEKIKQKMRNVKKFVFQILNETTTELLTLVP